MKSRNIQTNKKAVSLMISYVLLIVIVIGLAIGVYSWLKVVANISPAHDCPEGTSLILEKENCFLGNLELLFKNNGRFNIDGVIVAVGDNPKSVPGTYLIPEEQGGIIEGHYYFSEALKPQQLKTAIFTDEERVGSSEQPITFENISIIQIQPFIIEKNQRVVCQNSVITQEVSNCQIANLP